MRTTAPLQFLTVVIISGILNKQIQTSAISSWLVIGFLVLFNMQVSHHSYSVSFAPGDVRSFFSFDSSASIL